MGGRPRYVSRTRLLPGPGILKGSPHTPAMGQDQGALGNWLWADPQAQGARKSLGVLCDSGPGMGIPRTLCLE